MTVPIYVLEKQTPPISLLRQDPRKALAPNLLTTQTTKLTFVVALLRSCSKQIMCGAVVAVHLSRRHGGASVPWTRVVLFVRWWTHERRGARQTKIHFSYCWFKLFVFKKWVVGRREARRSASEVSHAQYHLPFAPKNGNPYRTINNIIMKWLSWTKSAVDQHNTVDHEFMIIQ